MEIFKAAVDNFNCSAITTLQGVNKAYLSFINNLPNMYKRRYSGITLEKQDYYKAMNDGRVARED